MGKKDIVTKSFMQDEAVFADALNAAFFNGELIIDPEKLTTMDTSEIALPFGKQFFTEPVQKFRDVLKYAEIKKDEHAIYLIAGIENQSQVHYAMPIRNLLYDLLQYAHQIEQITANHRAETPEKRQTSAEFLSGFHKDDRLIPVVTLVVYFSPKPWDGPRSIRDMMASDVPWISSLIPEYKLFLLEPAAMQEEDFRKFRTDLGPVLNFIKESRNKNRLRELVQGDSRFKDLDRKAAQVLETLTAVKIDIEENEEEVDMCKAIRDLMDDSKQEGKLEEKVNAVQNIMESLHLTLDQAMTALKITGEDREYCLRVFGAAVN